MSEIAEEDLEESEITSVAGVGYKFGKSSMATSSIHDDLKAVNIERKKSVDINEANIG